MPTYTEINSSSYYRFILLLLLWCILKHVRDLNCSHFRLIMCVRVCAIELFLNYLFEF